MVLKDNHSNQPFLLESRTMEYKIFGNVCRELIQLNKKFFCEETGKRENEDPQKKTTLKACRNFGNLQIVLENGTNDDAKTEEKKQNGYVKGSKNLSHPQKEPYLRGFHPEYAFAWMEADIQNWRLRRDAFIVSCPEEILAVRQTGRQMNLTISAEFTYPASICKEMPYSLIFEGKIKEDTDEHYYCFGIYVETDGEISLENQSLQVQNADYVIMYAALVTDDEYEKLSCQREIPKKEFLQKAVQMHLETAALKGYEALYEKHFADRELMEQQQKPEFFLSALALKNEKQLVQEYLPVLYFDRKEPFPIYAAGYTVFQSRQKSPSARRIIDPASHHAVICIEYAWYYDYDIQHLYDLEHTWIYIDNNGQVCGCESSFHGKFFNSMLTGKDILHGGKRVHLYVQPGKHAIMPSPEFFELFIGFNECCKELAGVDGILTPEIIPGMPKHSEKEDHNTRQYLKNVYGFTPSNQYAPYMERVDLKTWEELCAEIPERVRAGMDDIAAWMDETKVDSVINSGESGKQPAEKEIHSSFGQAKVINGKTYKEKELHTIEDLMEITSVLRSPDGCSWDKAQTHESMKQCLMNETNEVLQAIDKKDAKNLCEELGDLLFQVMLHSEIAKENGAFDFSDVVQVISDKMIRRHPHVFGNRKAPQTPEEGMNLWAEIKQKEKRQQM